MNNIEYWEKRKAQRMWEYMESAEDIADEIAQAYRKAAHYFDRNLDQIYDRFRSKHHLSNAEAKRLLNKMQDRTSFDELHGLLKQETDSEEKQELLKLIESPAYAARIRNLEEKQNEIDRLMKSIYHIEKEQNTKHYVNLAQDAYYKSIYDIQKETGLAFSFSSVSPKQIDKVLKSNWSGSNYSQRIWSNTNKLAHDLKEELLVNVMTGRSDREVAEIIRNKFSSGAMESRRLVRTESCYIANEMEMQSYEECGIERYMFIATLDKKTSKICQQQDKKVYNVKDKQPGKNCPPMHPWCRSTTIAVIDDEVLEDMTRKARDPETGDVYTVPANMNYEDWRNKFVERDETPQKVNTLKEFYAMDDKNVRMRVENGEAQLSNMSYEKAYVYDLEGNVILEKTGITNEVEFTEEELKLMKNAIVTHNHPMGTPLSPDDIYMAIEHDLQEVRATGDRGTFVLRRNENLHVMPNQEQFIKEYKEVLHKCHKAYMKKFGHKISENHHQQIIQMNGMAEMAKRYGLLYWREKR